MPAVRKRHIELLRPYLVGEAPVRRGEDEHLEWDMYCPLHDDTQRSAGINLDAGVWYCQAGCGGGWVTDLIRRKAEWVSPAVAATNGHAGRAAPKEEITDARIAGWVSALWSNADAVEELMQTRGLQEETLRAYEIGWDRKANVYTIPVRDSDGTILNVRRYTLHPAPGKRKIWSVNGMGTPTLYPLSVFDDNPRSIIICEGEWDALLTIQNGYAAVTRTGSAGTWKAEWGEKFAERVVYLCHDMDTAGQDANRRVARALERAAKDVRVLQLPYPVTDKHGKDLTDFWLEHGRTEFKVLLRASANAVDSSQGAEELDPADATVLDSFDARRVGRPLRLTVTIKGKRDPGYSIPREAALTCTRDAGDKCNVCPLHAAGGEDLLMINPNDAVVLELIEATRNQVNDVLRQSYGCPKCNKLNVEPLEYQSVELLFARPSVDHANGKSEDYKNVKLISVGRHDTQPNNTVQAVGALYPEPRNQLNSFLAWDVARMETSLDTFEVTGEVRKLLARFQPKRGQRPLKKLGEISKELAAHVTKIYGRPEMHALMDLVWHSALSFDFDGTRIQRGWLDALIVGDTRTGKSDAASKLMRHYGAGEMISCESASFAGIVGGLQQLGSSGREWVVTWGTVPINDRRMVVLDEVSGMTPDEIAAMSSVRSSGVAELNKIQQERTYARTRLLWLGNPRNARMSDFTYGVQAIRPLIGNAEDIARFDCAMSVRAGEVPAEEINRPHEAGRQRYTSAACQTLVRWVWSRTAEQVRWSAAATAAVYSAASELGTRYTEDPPLVQVANVRVKVARLAVAMAARLYSTDRTGECIVVRREHVEDAVAFMDLLYGMPSFGYRERSRELIEDEHEAHQLADDMKQWVAEQRGLAKFLRSNSSFRRQDIEEILNVERTEANAIINTLWEARMVRKEKGDVRVQPKLHQLLREVRA